MCAVHTGAAGGGLLERQGELDALRGAMDSARAGTGALVYVEAPAGLGKTELLTAACEEASARGVEVLRARGGHVEREVALGAARQLFAPVAAMAPAERDSLLSGAAALAAGPLGLTAPAEADAPAAADPSFADFHGLYWLTANLAARAPLLLSVDDAQWADAASLRYLGFLLPRLEELLGELAVAPGARVLRPAPLSPAAVAAVVEQRLGPPDPAFAAACHQVTGGT